MRCNNCGYESIDQNDIYCNNCGKKLINQKDSMLSDNGTNNGFPSNPYPPIPPSGKPKSHGNKGLIIGLCIALSLIICTVIISVTAITISRSDSDNASDNTTVENSSINEDDSEKNDSDTSHHSNEDSDDISYKNNKATDNTSDYNNENNNGDVRIYSGTRCKVDSYIDGNNSLQLRSTPNKNDKIDVYAGRNNYVTVLEDYYGGDFIKISILTEGHTYEGWVYAEYLHTVPDDEGIERTELSPDTECHVTYSDGLNLWKKPHSDSAKRKQEGSNGKAPYGATVEIDYQYNINDNGYAYVNYNGITGWMDAEYLELGEGDSYEVTTKATANLPELTISDAHELFRHAQMLIEEYYSHDNVDKNDSITALNPETGSYET